MRKALIVLAFCAAIYNVLGCFVQWMAGPETSGGATTEFLAFRTFAVCCIVCSFGALANVMRSALAVWVAAIAYLVISWKLNAAWVFHDQLIYNIFWTPIFLSSAAFTGRREEKHEESQ